MEFQINERAVDARDFPAHLTLLDFLRSKGLTGTKEGCAEGECGACAVALVASHGTGSTLRVVNSCLLFLPMLAGQEVYTVEGLARDGRLSEPQRAIAEHGGSQCGYCTPGFAVSLFAEYHRPGRTGLCDPHAMGGNLCRCTGYRPLRDAALELGTPPDDDFQRRLRLPAPPVAAFSLPHAEFAFERPASLPDCLALLHAHPEACLIAGATDLAVEANLRGRRWPLLVSVEAVPELRVFRDSPAEVEIGAGLALSEIESLWRDAPPVMDEWFPLFASPLIRNRATLGGNLATASPVGDAAPLLLALDAQVNLATREGRRRIPLNEFFPGYRQTAMQPGELMVSVSIPKPYPENVAFFKVAKRALDDISTVAAAYAVTLDSAGRVAHCRIAYGGVAATPVRVYAAEDALMGLAWDEPAVRAAQRAIAAVLRPMSDHRGSAAYRLAVAQTSTGEVLPPDTARGGRMKRTGQPLSHESAHGHVTGEALYTDDLLGRFPGLLHAWPVLAPHAHAQLTHLDASAALATPGVVSVLTAADVPGEGDSGPVRHDEPIFPSEVMFHNQPVAWVLGETLETARLGALAVVAEYQPLIPILSVEDAIARESFHSGPLTIRRGDTASELARSEHRIEGEIHIGGQEHFYLETQATIAWLDASGGVSLHSSTQHPSETQEIVARVLGVPRHMVTVECLRMGGAFGGKETQANCFAAVAALGARKTGRPVRIRFSRRLDMAITGKRHPFLARFAAGFDNEGRMQAARIHLYADGGWSLDLSEAILGRAMFHVDNAYYLPALEVTGWVCKTHKTSQTAFRGFGGPQGMLVIEDILDRIARTLELPPHTVRERNFYREGQSTHYGQPVKDAERIARIWEQLKESSEFAPRRKQIAAFNAAHRHCRRGIAITPVKFGISFTATLYNQAGALVLIYRDGSVQVNHGGTEMGQGLYTKIGQIAVDALGVKPEAIRLMPTRTDKIPNTSATAASSGADLNGAAVLDACRTLRATLDGVAAALLECNPADLHFENGSVDATGEPGRVLTFTDVVEAAYRQRLPLFASGYYRTPEIHYDPKTHQGRPFYYYAYGAAVSEVEVDAFTGQYRLLRADLLEDVGESLSPLVDRGQIEGGFIQGVGWLTLEELVWDAEGRLATNGASTYKLPSWSEMPPEFHVDFLTRAAEPGVVFGSKAVGEPPLMMALSVREALRDAVASFGPGIVELDSPCTPERIFFAIQRARAASEIPAPAAVGAIDS